MANPLTPTVITDRNGRVTTVHRKLENGKPVTKLIPAPAPTLPVQPEGTPLDLPPAMTAAEARRFIQSLPQTGELVLRQHDVAHMNHETELPLLIKLLEDKSIPESALRVAIKFMNDKGKINPNYHNTFLMMPLINEIKDQSMVATKIFAVMRAMNGWTDDKKPLPRITTQEEMASYTALTRFALAFDDDRNIVKQASSWIEGNSIASTSVVNKHLKQFVLDHPDDNEAIIQYVNERGGMHPKNKKPVDAIKVFLEGSRDNTAVASGWL